MEKRIAIFASGNGTNTETVITHFQQRPFAKVVLVLTNNERAKVKDRAKSLNVNCLHFSRTALNAPDGVLSDLKKAAPDLIVLAGFLWKFPELILKEFPNQVINIHPALLPKFGGKGMYGMHVHEAVVAARESETGITVHYVNENYDEGAIICQKKVAIDPQDTSKDVAAKVHQLEREHFPQIIEDLLRPEIN